jgi:hypothetical protein
MIVRLPWIELPIMKQRLYLSFRLIAPFLHQLPMILHASFELAKHGS